MPELQVVPDTQKAVGLTPASGGISLPSLTKRDFPMTPPIRLASPPAYALGAAEAASAISGSVHIPLYEPNAFTPLGPKLTRAATYPDYLGLRANGAFQLTPSVPWGEEFWLDTADPQGRFEVKMKGSGGLRVAVQQPNGVWGYISAGRTFIPPGDGQGYNGLVTLGAPGVYKIRFECSGDAVVYGVNVGKSDSVNATASVQKTYTVIGDSFTEPTIVDTGPWGDWDGWVSQLSYMTNLNLICAGSGGTGYLHTYNGRVKFRDRLDELLAVSKDGIVFAGGINDMDEGADALYTEALLCFQRAREVLGPNGDIIVLSPFFPKSLVNQLLPKLFDNRDALKRAAAVVGAKFLDVLSLPAPSYLNPVSAVLTAAAPAYANFLMVDKVSSLQESGGWYVYLNSGGNGEVCKVRGVEGTGPYKLSIVGELAYSHAAGDAVTLAGPSYMTGTGKQGSPANDGNADRFTSSDGTHPTAAGHKHIARVVANLWHASLPA